MMIVAGREIRYARRLLLQICFAVLCAVQHRPTSGCSSSSLILLSAATNVHFAAAAVVGAAAEGEVRRVETSGIGETGHLDDEKSPRLPDTYSTADLRTIQGSSAEDPAAGAYTGGVDEASRPSEETSELDAVEHEEEGYDLQLQRRRRLRQPHHPFRKLDANNNNNNNNNNHDENGKTKNPVGDSSVAARSDGGSKPGDKEDGGMVKFRLGGKIESFMAGNVMQTYLNQLVEESVADTKNQTCNIAFVKTHKTASTTAATIFYRYGKRHNLNVANFDGHQSSIELPEAVKQIEQSGKPVDLMHYHHAWDGFYEGRWADAKAAYKKILRDPSVVKLVTVMREPVSHYMSYYYYFLQPETGLSITEYLTLPKKPDDPQFQGVFHQQRRAGKGIGWHGFKLLYNPLCAEFGIRTAQELEDFIRDDLPEFAMIMLTEQFEESLAVFMRMFNWRPIDMTYCRVIETKEGEARYDGKLLANVPKIHELPPEVLIEIKRQTQLDQVLYKAAAKIYLKIRKNYEDRLEEDVRNIRTIQSAVHAYLDFDSTSPAHEWYEGDVHCFADPSPVQPF